MKSETHPIDYYLLASALTVILFFLGKHAKTIFENIKKRYLKRRNALKKADKSGTSSAVVDKAKRELGVYAFLFWLENFVKPRKTKDNIEEEVIENEDDGEDQELEECEEQDEDVDEEPVVKKKEVKSRANKTNQKQKC